MLRSEKLLCNPSCKVISPEINTEIMGEKIDKVSKKASQLTKMGDFD